MGIEMIKANVDGQLEFDFEAIEAKTSVEFVRKLKLTMRQKIVSFRVDENEFYFTLYAKDSDGVTALFRYDKGFDEVISIYMSKSDIRNLQQL